MPGFINAVTPNIVVAKQLQELYYLAFPLGFVISFLVYWALNVLDKPRGVDEIDEVDYFGTFTFDEAQKMGLRQLGDIESVEVVHQNKVSEENQNKDPEVKVY